MTHAVVIVAAGRGVRAGGALPKQYRQLAGRPVLWHTVRRFLAHARIDLVQVAIHPDDHDAYIQALGDLRPHDKLLPPTHGGAARQDSVRLGLEALVPHAPDTVLIHDAARPFVSAALIDRLIDACTKEEEGTAIAGAIAALPVVDTLKRADASGLIAETVDRAHLWRAQTPQAFRFAAITRAHRDMAGRTLTDDAAVAEAAGLNVRLVEGDPDNIKLTTPSDFDLAERFLRQADGGPGAPPPEIRVGHGFDVHRFGEGRAVTLCGVTIPHDRGLLGHSDADVALHALTDALLGALGAGDIGQHFPPSDDRWRGAPSHVFLAHAASLVAARQGRIVNIDLTLICERPKIGPHRAAMVARIADILGIDADRVSLKATTTERLGFTGRGEGLAAEAVAAVSLPCVPPPPL